MVPENSPRTQRRSGDGLAALERRRYAAKRSEPLACGCRDPWPGRCHDEPIPLSDNQLDGWAEAAQLLLDLGLTPILPLASQRGLYRRGGADRRLVGTLRVLVGAA